MPSLAKGFGGRHQGSIEEMRNTCPGSTSLVTTPAAEIRHGGERGWAPRRRLVNSIQAALNGEARAALARTDAASLPAGAAGSRHDEQLAAAFGGAAPRWRHQIS